MSRIEHPCNPVDRYSEVDQHNSDAIKSRRALVRVAIFGVAFISALGGIGVICSDVRSQLQNLAAAFDGGHQKQADEGFKIVAPVILPKAAIASDNDLPKVAVAAPTKQLPKTLGEACQRLIDGEKNGSDGVDIALEQLGDMFEFPNPDLHEIREKCNFRDDELMEALKPALQRGDEEIGALVANDIRAECGGVHDEPFMPSDAENSTEQEGQTLFSDYAAECHQFPLWSLQADCRLKHTIYRMESCVSKFPEGITRDDCEDMDKARE